MVGGVEPLRCYTPFEFDTVAAAVESTAARWPAHGYTFQDLKGRDTTYSFPQLERASSARARALQKLGLQKGDRLALVVIEPEDFVLTFFAALRLGVIAVPIYPPISLGNIDAYARRTARILQVAGARVIVVSASLRYVLWSFAEQMPSVRRIVPVESLRDATGAASFPEVRPDDIAFLQFTSGSTMDPRGVMVTHACLLANARGIVDGLGATAERDIGVTWLPLYHDMGLVGFVITTMCTGISVVFIPTLRFLRNPAVWMETIHRHRATISFGPNFSYALAARRMTPDRLRRWDLSCIRVLGCGGEPVNLHVVRAFTRLFHEDAGLVETAVRPGYGLAEGTLTTSLTPVSRGIKTLRVDQQRFQEERIVALPRDGRPSIEHVSVGRVMPGHTVLIVASDGTLLPDGCEGEILMRGPSVAPGYFNNPEATAAVFRDGTLHTGDLGYLKDGYLYVTGRLKDLIIHNGRNIHPQSIEWVVEQLEGALKGNVVAIAVPGEETERIVVVMETRGTQHDALTTRVQTAVQRELAVPVAQVVFLGRGELPKTSSGKLQRQFTRQQYLAGTLGKGNRTTRPGVRVRHTEVVRHLARGVWNRVKYAIQPQRSDPGPRGSGYADDR